MFSPTGGVVAERPSECTVLVTTGVKRTIKFIACFALGTPIVSTVWLTKSKTGEVFSRYDSNSISSVDKFV